jgi:hypothetical protein
MSSTSLNNMLQAILSVSAEEQSMFYAPKVYSAQYNAVSSLLKSALVKSYPANPMVLDQLDPFIKIAILPVVDGYVELPADYRDILGSPFIFVNKDATCECGEDIEPLTVENFKIQTLKGGCKARPIQILPESEFYYRTDSTYNFPSIENPIGYFAGKKRIKICPYDVGKVGIMYVIEDKQYVYGYIMQPDDTYLFDPATTIESEWQSNVYEPFFNALCSLYSVYAKDQEMTNWSVYLNEKGIL